MNDQWNVVALHHSGVPKKDDKGNVLTHDGSIWTPDMGDDAINWISNEGIRISAIIEQLKKVETGITGKSKDLLNELIRLSESS